MKELEASSTTRDPSVGQLCQALRENVRLRRLLDNVGFTRKLRGMYIESKIDTDNPVFSEASFAAAKDAILSLREDNALAQASSAPLEKVACTSGACANTATPHPKPPQGGNAWSVRMAVGELPNKGYRLR